MRRRTGFLIALGTAFAAASPAAAAPVLQVGADGREIRATPGVACVQVAEEDGTPRGRCKGKQYPLRTRGRLRLGPGERIVLRFSRAPSSVKWRLLRRSAARPETAVGGAAARSRKRRRHFVVRLPHRVPCARVLDVYATYGRGHGRRDQVWWAGVHVLRPACRRR